MFLLQSHEPSEVVSGCSGVGFSFRDTFFPSVTLAFLPTVNGQHHRGLSPPKPALWSRPRLGKQDLVLCPIINPSVAFAASSPPPQLILVFLSPSILFINTVMFIHPSVRPSVGLSVHVAFCPTCLLSHRELLQVLLARTSSNNQVDVGDGA